MAGRVGILPPKAMASSHLGLQGSPALWAALITGMPFSPEHSTAGGGPRPLCLAQRPRDWAALQLVLSQAGSESSPCVTEDINHSE